MSNYKPIAENIMSFTIVEDEDRKLHLQRRCGTLKDPEENLVGLYLVTLTMERYSESGQGHKTKLVDSVSTYFVLAESEEGAISQVSDAPLGDKPHERFDKVQKGQLRGTATRLPMHIRGWGLQTF